MTLNNFNIIKPKKSILTMLDFDDCLFPHTITYYLPVLRDMLKDEIRRLKPTLTDQEYMEGEKLSLSLYGSYFHYWQDTLAADDPDWTNRVYLPMLPEQVKGVKANLVLDPAIVKAIADLNSLGHTIYIVTHGHINYCWPLVQHAGLDIPKHRIFDLQRADYTYKSSGKPYQAVQKLEGREFDMSNMADDSIANLRPLRDLNILSYYINEKAPQPEDRNHFDYHHENILPALRFMAAQSE